MEKKMYKSVELLVGNKLLRGCVRAPEGEGPFPTVCFFHGFSVDKIGLMRLHELFARRCVNEGFACVRFDFYGCGESEGDFNEMRFSDEVEQAKAIYSWTVDQNFADAQNVFLAGHSMGGAIVSMIAPLLQPKGAILWSPGNSAYYDISERVHAIPGHYKEFYDIGGLALSGAFLSEIRAIDMVKEAEGYNTEVLLIHGEKDEKIPISSIGLYLDMYGKNLTTEIIWGANHQFSSLDWKQQVYDKSIEYLKRRVSQ